MTSAAGGETIFAQRSIWVKLYAFNPAPFTEKDSFPPFFKKNETLLYIHKGLYHSGDL